MNPEKPNLENQELTEQEIKNKLIEMAEEEYGKDKIAPLPDDEKFQTIKLPGRHKLFYYFNINDPERLLHESTLIASYDYLTKKFHIDNK